MDRREEMEKNCYPSFLGYHHGYAPGPGLQPHPQGRAALFGQHGLFLPSGPNLNAPLPPYDIGGGCFPPALREEPPSVQQHVHTQELTQEFHSQEQSQEGIQQVVKKKRGRPRKYETDKQATLEGNPGQSVPNLGSGGGSESESVPKKGRGRPKGSGSRQKLASIGGLMLSSAGSGFKPHVLKVSAGEDIVAKLLAFSQKGSKTVCILSASGVISMVSIQVPHGNTRKYEGHFEILNLTGSYVFGDDLNSHLTDGGLSICLSNSECCVFGGPIHGPLLAASPVLLIVASFSHNGAKETQKTADGIQTNTETEPTDAGDGDQEFDCSSPRDVDDSDLINVRAGSGQIDTRCITRDIDLTKAVNY